jgi:HD-GYP domain-containing protein (c-di-GMP phosphodiesterase class II)
VRPSRSVLGTIVLGVVGVAGSLWHIRGVDWTSFALFLAGAILVELLEGADRGRSREPMETDRFHLAAAVQVAAVLVLGPWAGALVAAAGRASGALFRGTPPRVAAFGASAYTLAALAGGLAFRIGGGETGALRLLDDTVPLVVLGIAYLTVRALLVDVLLKREPFDPKLGVAAGEVALGAAAALLASAHSWNVLALVPLAIAVHQAQLRETRLKRETLRALETFANIVDERDPSTYRHSVRVAASVDRLARALALPFSDIDRLRWAGRLHDLGKVAVDSSLLRKRGRLDGAEWAAMRRHPRLSARLLQRFDFVATQARAVELHHERMDGGGYYGVAAADLPLASHFLIVADSFDAMITDRPYRPGLSREEALAEIERNVGTQFHPAVAKAFGAVERGLDPATLLTPDELDEIRGASASTRRGSVPGGRDLKERPELLAFGGVVVALVGLGFDQRWVGIAGVAAATIGLVLRALARARSERLTKSLRRALHAPTRPALFDELVDRLDRAWPTTYAALVAWDEDGLGGRVERSRGEGPTDGALMSWLVREAESGADIIVSAGIELGREGIELALPLRRDNSALVGFLVVEARRLPPRHVELALLETLDDIGLALAARPGLAWPSARVSPSGGSSPSPRHPSTGGIAYANHPLGGRSGGCD